MGIKQVVVDDLTGKEIAADTKPTAISIDGTEYEVYLGDESLSTLEAFARGEATLLKWMEDARRRPTSTKTASSSGRGRKPTETHGYERDNVRAWAFANGWTLDSGKKPSDSIRGLPQSWYDKYRDLDEDGKVTDKALKEAHNKA